eukprot:4136064-Amphidinium_carterae.2
MAGLDRGTSAGDARRGRNRNSSNTNRKPPVNHLFALERAHHVRMPGSSVGQKDVHLWCELVRSYDA